MGGVRPAPAPADRVDLALEYAARGWAVFPVHSIRQGRCSCGHDPCPKKAGKHPRTVHGFKESTASMSAVLAWWTQWRDANIGIPTGTHFTALDVDPRYGGDEALRRLESEHGRLPATWRVLTGGGGFHVLFQPVPGLRDSTAVLGPGLDIRGEGGYVIAAGSTHVSGRDYVWEIGYGPDDVPLAPMPAWIVERLTKPRGTGNAADDDEWVRRLSGVPLGQQNTTATQIAGRLAAKGLSAGEIGEILVGFGARCTPPISRDDAATFRDIAQRIWEKEQAKAPASPAGETNGVVPYESLRAVLDRWVADRDGPPVVRIKTPSESLNKLLGGGFTPGELLYLGARPGLGKTSLALEYVRHAGRLGHGVLVISREMATLALACRMLAQTVRVGVGRIRTHQLAPGERVLVEGGLPQLAGLPVWLTEAALTLGDITQLVETFPQPLALLVVDYLQLIEAPRYIKERRLQIEHISAALKALAQRRALATLCLSSLTRYGDGRDDARPTMAHLRESGELEHDADVVLLLHRQPNAAETDLIIAKARNAQTGVVRLRFHAEYTAFDEAAGREPGET
jgi:DnaB-like helicase C terminal domain/Bifunctional DNA primase/polymerase, N-terminal